MKGVLQEVHERLSKGDKVAVARVVEVIGSGVRPAGATVAVCGTEVIGSASGGCVEGAVVEEARAALVDGGRPRIRVFGCSEDEVFNVGLTCGGVVRVLVEGFELGHGESFPWLEQLFSAVGSGKGAALLEVIDGPEELLGWKGVVEVTGAPRPAGSAGMDFLWPGGKVPAELVQIALADVAAERSAVHSFRARHEAEETEVSVFVDAFPAPPEMILIGATSFTAALAAQAKLLGYRVVVCDARPVFATGARFPAADDVVTDWPHRYLEKVGSLLGRRDAVCILTHEPKFDVPATLAALATTVGYIGVMGSRRAQEDRKRRLRGAGVADIDLDRLHGPLGLDLGATSPEETAVSVVADIIATRYGRSGGPLAVTSGPIHPLTHPVACGVEDQPALVCQYRPANAKEPF